MNLFNTVPSFIDVGPRSWSRRVLKILTPHGAQTDDCSYLDIIKQAIGFFLQTTVNVHHTHAHTF